MRAYADSRSVRVTLHRSVDRSPRSLPRLSVPSAHPCRPGRAIACVSTAQNTTNPQHHTAHPMSSRDSYGSPHVTAVAVT
eukprot:1007047-Rhodomonas_salina.3